MTGRLLGLMPRYVLRLSCPDRKGIVHAVAGALLEVDANICENAQFGDELAGRFCMRTLFETASDAAAVTKALGPVMTDIEAEYTIRADTDRPKVLIMVSRFDHCLLDLLYRWASGELAIDIVCIVSNHGALAHVADSNGIRFEYLPITPDNKAEQEDALRSLIAQLDVDLVVLARYMQVLTNELCAELTGKAINIHHSFLPGFKGARPYHQAYDRGVKLIGATAHFVTPDLDEGPIIEQDVARVDHSHSAEEMVEIGRDVERTVLSKAVRYWAEDRIVLVGDRTVVFR